MEGILTFAFGRAVANLQESALSEEAPPLQYVRHSPVTVAQFTKLSDPDSLDTFRLAAARWHAWFCLLAFPVVDK